MAREIPLALSYDDVLLVPQGSDVKSRRDVDLSTQLTPKLNLGIPLISANMSDVTGIDMAIALGNLGGLGILPRFRPIEEQMEMVREVKRAGVLTVASIGIKNGCLEDADRLVQAGAIALTIDVAHGHLKEVARVTNKLREHFGREVDLIVGNIATREGAADLFRAGADCVKVGVGPGSICTTRLVAGSGVPQFTAVDDAGEAAQYYKKTIIADGGIRSSGDVVKALAVGAAAVMIGSQFAGTDEAPGERITLKEREYKVYNGSTSSAEKKKHQKKGEDDEVYQRAIEGVNSYVPYRGRIEDIVNQYLQGLRSGFSYAGALNLRELWENARFVRITDAGRRESEPHDVILNQSI